MKVRYFEKRGNTWADFRINGDRKRMDTGAAWGEEGTPQRRQAEAAMPALIARCMAPATAAAAVPEGPQQATVRPSGHTLKAAYKHAMKVREQWIKAKDKKTLEQTYEALIESTKDAAPKLRLTEDTDLAVFTRDFVRELRVLWLKEPGKRKGTTLSASTINHRLSMLSVLLEACDLPPHTVKHLSTKGNRRKRRVSDEEVRKGQSWLLANSHLKNALDMVDLITVGLDIGARQTELLEVPWSRIDLQARTIQFDDTKNAESRVVPIPDASLIVLERRKATQKGGPFQCFDQDRATALWDLMRAGLGLEEDHAFVFHILRHEFCSRLADKGTNAFTIMALAGHDDISTTQVYVKASLGAMMAAQGVSKPAQQPTVH